MLHRRTVVFLLALLSFVGGLISGRELLFFLTYGLGFILLVSFAWAWVSLRWTSLARITRVRRTQVGRPLEERFRVQNTSFIPKLWLEVRDFSNVPAHQASYVVNTMTPNAEESWRVSTVCQQRGRYQLGPMLLRTSDPFGLFPLEKPIEATTNVVIYPLTVDIYNFSLPIGILPGGEALRRRTHYVTTNAAGVRDYAPGDSFSRIHWRSSARRDRLIVKEFELDPLADIWIVPDMSRYEHIEKDHVEAGISLTDADIPRFMQNEQVQLTANTEEYTVTISASLAQYFLRLGRAVGLMGYGQVNELIQPDRGERQLNRILETLAVLRAEGELPLDYLLQMENQIFPRGTTVIIVSPTTRTAWAGTARQLKQKGLRVVTVLVNPASFGGGASSQTLVNLLHATGTGVYTVNEGDNLTHVLSHGRG